MKKVIAFDLDGTLADSKSPLSERMAELLSRLLDKFKVCVISGGKFGQFEKQLLSKLRAEPAELGRLHIMPTSGTRYYAYDSTSGEWQLQYAEDFSEAEKQRIVAALNKGFDDLGMREKNVYGECVEDRGSQVTFSVLGQDIVDELGPEGVRLKEAWDPDNKKKLALCEYIGAIIPEFEVRGGGVTSIDVTKLGIDKAYGMKKLMDVLHINKQDILFVGDRLQPGGNDYAVKAAGIDSIEVADWRQTAIAVEAILQVTN